MHTLELYVAEAGTRCLHNCTDIILIPYSIRSTCTCTLYMGGTCNTTGITSSLKQNVTEL